MRAGIFVRAVPVPVLFVALILAMPARDRPGREEQACGDDRDESCFHFRTKFAFALDISNPSFVSISSESLLAGTMLLQKLRVGGLRRRALLSVHSPRQVCQPERIRDRACRPLYFSTNATTTPAMNPNVKPIAQRA